MLLSKRARSLKKLLHIRPAILSIGAYCPPTAISVATAELIVPIDNKHCSRYAYCRRWTISVDVVDMVSNANAYCSRRKNINQDSIGNDFDKEINIYINIY